MTDREIMQQALEALETKGEHHERVYAAIEALRQALAQEQTKCPRCGKVNPAEIHTCSPQREQEPVAWKDKAYGNLHHQNFGNSIPLYTAPPKREWVGLTDQEIKGILDCKRGGLVDIKKAEQFLKEKNK